MYIETILKIEYFSWIEFIFLVLFEILHFIMLLFIYQLFNDNCFPPES